MRRIWTIATALSLASTAACNFLDSPKAVADPNNPTLASTNQLFVGVQANILVLKVFGHLNVRLNETYGGFIGVRLAM